MKTGKTHLHTRVFESGTFSSKIRPLQALRPHILHHRTMLLLQAGHVAEIVPMIQRRAAEIVDAVGSDRSLHFRPCQALELGFGTVDDFEVPGRDVGEEGGALGRPVGFGDVEEPVGEGSFSGSVCRGGVYCRVGF